MLINLFILKPDFGITFIYFISIYKVFRLYLEIKYFGTFTNKIILEVRKQITFVGGLADIFPASLN